MKYLILIPLGLFVASANVSAAPQPALTAEANQHPSLMIDWKAPAHKCSIKSKAGPQHQGCCSHHGGVCGCDSAAGAEKCCDGEDSPTCGCD